MDSPVLAVGWVLSLLATVEGLQGDALEVRREGMPWDMQAGTIYFDTGVLRLGAALMRPLLEQWSWNRDFA